MLRERRIHQLQKQRKEQAGLWLLAVGAFFLAFNPLSIKEVFFVNTSAISPTDLLVTNFIDTLQTEATEENMSTGIGGIETESSEISTNLYTLQPGESLLNVAKREGLHIDTLLSANEVKTAQSVSVGQEIKIPNQEGVFHKVERGQTLSNVARAYRTDLGKILAANDIDNPRRLRVGKKIFIPGAKLLPPKRKYLLGDLNLNLNLDRGFVKPIALAWSSSGYGYRSDPFSGRRAFHSGIDLAAFQGTSVRAAKGGKVTFSGWGGGYGNLISVRHNDGYVTYYAHLSRRAVESGQWVEQGQTIGQVGSTGRSLGSHLHFEIRKNGQVVNPSVYLHFRFARS